MNKMLTITEPMLIDALDNKAVSSFFIIQNENDTYSIKVNLKWKEGDIYLVTVRNKNKPREWVSLDRMIKHIKSNYPKLRSIYLEINSSEIKKQE